MTKESNMKEQLLKQMDTEPEREEDSIQEILVKERRRVNRAKFTAIISLILVILLSVGVEFIGRITSHQEAAWRDAILWTHSAIYFVALMTAIISTISYFLRSRRLNQRKIEARLSNIETLLKKISKGQ